MTSIDPETYADLSGLAMRLAGLHLPETKRAFVLSRLQRRLRRLGLSDFGTYATLLNSADEAGSLERDAFVSALTTNVTEIYREAHHFALLAEHLDRWRADRAIGQFRYRIWSAGCATGEEPLSIASTCRAVLGRGWRAGVRILATDVDRVVIERAVARSQDMEFDVEASLARLPDGVTRWARDQDAPSNGPVDELRRGIEFMHHNVLTPLPNDESFDAIFCRNVTIYFDEASRNAAHDRLRGRLAPGGLLAIGHSERLVGGSSDMTPIGRTAYRKVVPHDRSAHEGHRACR